MPFWSPVKLANAFKGPAARSSEDVIQTEYDPSTPSTPSHGNPLPPQVLINVRYQHPNLSNFQATPHPPGQFADAPAASSTPVRPSSSGRSGDINMSPFILPERGDAAGNGSGVMDGTSGYGADEHEPDVGHRPSPATPSSAPSSAVLSSQPSGSSLESPSRERVSRMQKRSMPPVVEAASVAQLEGEQPPSPVPRASLSFPNTPNLTGRRSILRAPQTPGTGRSARFAQGPALEAYKFISPNTTGTSTSSVGDGRSVEQMLRAAAEASPVDLEFSADDVNIEEGGDQELQGFAGELFAASSSSAARRSDVSSPHPAGVDDAIRTRQSSLSPLNLHRSPPSFEANSSSESSLSLALAARDVSNPRLMDVSLEIQAQDSAMPAVGMHDDSPSTSLAGRGLPSPNNSQEDQQWFASPNASGANVITSFVSVLQTHSPNAVAAPARSVADDETAFLSFSDVQNVQEHQVAVSENSSSPSPVSSFIADGRGVEQPGSPLGSTPDASVYVSMADMSLARASMSRDASRQSIGVRRPLEIPDTANQGAVASTSQLLPEAPIARAQVTPWFLHSLPSAEASSSNTHARIFSRSEQPVEGIVAAIPEQDGPEQPPVDTPDASLAYLPGKFNWWRRSSRTEVSLVVADSIASTTVMTSRTSSGSTTPLEVIATQDYAIECLQVENQKLRDLLQEREAQFARLEATQPLGQEGRTENDHDVMEMEREELGSLTREVQMTREELQAVWREVQTIRDAHETAQREIRRVTNEKEEVERANLALRVSQDGWHLARAQMENQIQELNDMTRDAETSHEQVNNADRHDPTSNELERLRLEKQELAEENLALHDEVRIANNKAEEVLREGSADNGSHDILTHELDQLRLQVKELASKDRSPAENLAAKEEENNALRDELRISQGGNQELARLRAQATIISESQEELQSLRTRFAAVEEQDVQLQSLLAQVEAQDEELRALRNRIEQLDAELQELPDLRARAKAAKATEADLAVHKAELEAQWANAEKDNAKIETLSSERNALRVMVSELKEKLQNMDNETTEAREAKLDLARQLREAWEQKAAAEDVVQKLTISLEEVQDEFDQERQSLETLKAQHESDRLEREAENEEFAQLQDEYAQLQAQHEETDEARTRLEELLRTRDQELLVASERILALEREMDTMRSDFKRNERDYKREIDELQRQLQDAGAREAETNSTMHELIRSRAVEEVTSDGQQGRVRALEEEIARLRKQVHELQVESADNGIKLMQLDKAKNQYKDDKDGLNLALEAKQQELDLLKRKYGLKGVAGQNTPAPNRIASRPPSRESAPFSTPVAPTTGRSNILSASVRETRERRATLGPADPIRASLRSSVSANAVPASATKPMSRRTSVLSTPTPASLPAPSAALLSRSQSSLAGSLSGIKGPLGTNVPPTHRRASSALGGGLPTRKRIPETLRRASQLESLQSVEDKENEEPELEELRESSSRFGDQKARRKTMLPA